MLAEKHNYDFKDISKVLEFLGMDINYEKLIASINKYMHDEQISQEEFAHRIGTKQGTLSMWLSQKRKPGIKNINKILDILDIPDEEIIITQSYGRGRITRRPNYVPLISWIHAGKFGEKVDCQEIGIGEPLPYYGNDKNAYALIVEGNSMEPVFLAGDHIIVSPNAYVNSGDYCIVELNGEAILKRLIKVKDDLIILRSINPRFNDITVNGAATSFKILGKVVKKIVDF